MPQEATDRALLHPDSLFEAWTREHFVESPPECLRHDDVAEALATLGQQHRGVIEVTAVGHSFEGKVIHLLTIGHGQKRVLLWSQMHGDEPTATSALLDTADFLARNAKHPEVAALLDSYTLLMVPMLNPDGAEIYSRRNAQGIDINRDALNLTTPEGRLLARLREEHEPMLAFNLHDQNRRNVVGDTGVLAQIALLAVAGDEQGTITEGRERTMRICSAIADALTRFAPGAVARYDEDWSPRAFGDNFTAWGTPTVLIESGGVPEGGTLTDLVRLNFVALASVLAELTHNDVGDHHESIYQELPRNRSEARNDVVVRGGDILQLPTTGSYRADLAFNIERPERSDAACRAPLEDTVTGAISRAGEPRSLIIELGDARFLSHAREIDARGLLVVPSLTLALEGWPAPDWLDGAAIERAARAGLGSLVWSVNEAHTGAARARAGQLVLETTPSVAIEIVESLPSSLPRWRAVPGRAQRDAEASLAGALASLLGTETSAIDYDMLAAVWGSHTERFATPALRPGVAASFLLLRTSPSPADDQGLLGAAIAGVWLDGIELEATAVPGG